LMARFIVAVTKTTSLLWYLQGQADLTAWKVLYRVPWMNETKTLN
jgi:hypothetical protein